MSWQTEMTEVLRVMVGDLDEADFTDDTLQRTIVVAAMRVNAELDFAQDYTVNIQTTSISPDPTATATKDDSFVNLVCLYASCVISRGAARKATDNSIRVKDGSIELDFRDKAKDKISLLDKNWCQEYQQAKFEHSLDRSRVAGAAVMTPIRLLAGGNEGLWSPYR